MRISSAVGEESLNDDMFKADYTDINNNKGVESENNVNLFKSNEVQKSHSNSTTKLSSDISNFSDDNIHDWQHLCMKNNSLNDSLTYKYDYKEVDKEPVIEESVEDEDFSFLINYLQENENSENLAIIKELVPNLSRNHSNIGSSLYLENLNDKKLTQILKNQNIKKTMDTKSVVEGELEQNSFENDSNIANSSYTANAREKKSTQTLEKSSMTKIMNNQSKIEDSMIRMFKSRLNAFPDYRLHLLGVKTSHKFNNQTVNPNEYILPNFNKFDVLLK